MSRKHIVRELPALESLFPNFQPFGDGENKLHELERFLRKAVAKVQGNERKNFYSMREVARFFNTSLKAVSIVYDRLSKEALITVVRGSKTVLEGRRKAPKTGLRGVVGVPVALPSFIFGNNPRSFFIRLEDELRRQDYVVDFIFYSSPEAGSHELVERLLAHQLDIVFWNSPASQVNETMLRLQDAGVHLVVVGDGPGMFPVQQYILDLDQGFRETAVGWRAEGLKEVHLIGPEKELAPHFRRKVRMAFQMQGFVVKDEMLGEEVFFERSPELQRRKDAGLVFLEHFHYEGLCNYDWRAMEAIFKSRRSLLAQGPVFHTAFTGRSIFVDTLELGLNLLARRVSLDIVQQRYLSRQEPKVFEASWLPNTNLGEVRREL